MGLSIIFAFASGIFVALATIPGKPTLALGVVDAIFYGIAVTFALLSIIMALSPPR